jgi:hypothetical protein
MGAWVKPGHDESATTGGRTRHHSAVIPGPERSEGTRNPVITAGEYWIPDSPLRGAPE